MDTEVLNILKRIEERLDNIEKIIETNQKSVRKMDEHIDFIDILSFDKLYQRGFF